MTIAPPRVTTRAEDDPAAPDQGLGPDGLARLIADIGEDGIAELIDMFDEETSARLMKLSGGQIALTELAREMHSLKGAAATVHAACLHHKAAELERRLHRGGTICVRDIDDLIEAFGRWRAAMKTRA